ncbi:MAG: bifunctional 4'-phosphopantothenoylcysteine decarboxylase/phosphopantothenoylcysteine synthetase, partial [Desulfobulbaceae bacterium A2]
GVCGGIAAYKVAGWLRELVRDGAEVTVVMTAAAQRFVGPLTFAALSGRRVECAMFDADSGRAMEHIRLAREAELVLVAPATANSLARFAHGLADDLLAAILLATRAPVVLCPSMNSDMFVHPATQDNLARLAAFGYHLVTPASGELACGEEGPGRLPEWDPVREQLLSLLSPQDLQGRTVLVSAGPTREALDPARFLSNRSSGRMGYALARAARRRGASVRLVSGPTALPDPPGVSVTRVASAAEMAAAILQQAEGADVVAMAAAVADFRPGQPETHKVKKGAAALTLALERTVDILGELGRRPSPRPLLLGFAAESRDHLAEGRRKLKAKKLDCIAVNDIGGSGTGFEVDSNQVTLIDADGEHPLPHTSKDETAARIWDHLILRLVRRIV